MGDPISRGASICDGRLLIDAESAGQETVIQIAPLWIEGLNKLDFPRATPVLDLCLAINGIANIAMLFVPDEHIHLISGRETGGLTGPVLPCPVDQIVGDAAVERTVAP